MNLLFTRVELDLVKSLTRCVRILEFSQLSAGWWPAVRRPRGIAQQLTRLQSQGLLETFCINAHPLLSVDRPLYAWQPGIDEPDFDTISDAARERWCRPAVPTMVCVAKPLAANLFGSGGYGLPPQEHRDHDLRLAAVYLHYRQKHARLAKMWIGEHALPKAGYRVKDPDAFLIDKAGQKLRVVESAGRYSAQAVESFHEHCVENCLSYELW